MANFDETAKRRIRFLTRRGLLELDIVLGRFMEKEFDNLSDEELSVFVEILELPDPSCRIFLPPFLSGLRRIRVTRPTSTMITSGRAALASGGQISGCGLASANTIGLSFMAFSISVLSTLGPERPRKMSFPGTASPNTRWPLSAMA